MRWAGLLAALMLGTAWAAPPAKGGRTASTAMRVAVVSLAEDPRLLPRRLEQRWPGQPQGRLWPAAQLAAEDARTELDDAGLQMQLRDASAKDEAGLQALLQQLARDGFTLWLLDLPDAALAAALAQARQAGALAINASSAQDGLRAQGCGAAVLHTYPSQAMLSDALAQYLAGRNWRQVLVLQGPHEADQLLAQAWQRAAKRYGLKTTETRSFRFSADPREREAANPRLLTAERGHEVVAVWDTQGEFARSLVYATQWPRPVVGSNGLVPLAWHPLWERYGGPQLNRRFARLAQRPMAGQDWAAWVGIKALVTAAVAQGGAGPAQLAQRLKADLRIDGFKGLALSFRPWDGQLRQPVLLGHADGVTATAPVEGVLHPTDTLDTLGLEAKDSPCKSP